MGKVFIIAEAGVNHNGSLRLAKKMVEAAAIAGADAVKFQIFKAENMVSRFAPKAFYQKIGADCKESQFDMLKKLELDENAHKELIQYCRNKKIIFLSSPFDLKSIVFLSELGLRIFKIPSGEITNLPYLRKIGELKKDIILSTGMATLKEIQSAVRIIIESGTNRNNIAVMHCNTEYPTPMEDVNLRAMAALRNKLKLRIGYSDHTLGIEIPIAAAALGAELIEKHFTLGRDMSGPDHKAALEPGELSAMVRAIRNIEVALGKGIKISSPSELKNRQVVRKSIVAARLIKKGEPFREENITTKRPGTGISPMMWDRVLGKKAKRNFYDDELIEI